ncbi:MAG: hypothetical protein ACYDBB_22735 [Armatimonadota bacterium]
MRVLFLLLLGLLTLPVLAFEKTITLTDYTGRGFAPELVQYDLHVTRGQAAKLRVYGADGTVLPAQVSTPDKAGLATLSFVTDLPPNGTIRYLVRDDGKGKAPISSVTVAKEGAAQVLANGLFGVKVPATTEQKFKQPVAAKTLPAPILAFRIGTGAWLGGGTQLSARPVSAYRVKLVANGPAYTEVRYELDFANGSYYHANIRVVDRMPVALVREEFDMKEGNTPDAWELNVTHGWAPDTMEVASAQGNGQLNPGKNQPLSQLGATPNPITSGWEIVPDSAWGPRSYLGLLTAADQQANPGSYPLVACVPLHKGDWRRMNAIDIISPDSKQVSFRFPFGVRNASWLRDVTSETSPFSMQEHEPGLPLTYGRRVWGLQLGLPPLKVKAENQQCGPVMQARLLYGVVGLDRYKDYVLSWPDTKVTYPREFLRADEVEKYKQSLDKSPMADKLKKSWYALSGDEAIAKKRTADAKSRLSWLAGFMVSSPTIGHHAMAPNYTIAAAVDDALGWANMPAADRAEIRAKLALVTYLYEEPDVMSYADGSHSGNPNMGTARTAGMGNFLPLLPDHPMFAKWRDHISQYIAYKISEQTAPGGGYFEFGGAYHMHGYARVTNALIGLEAAEAGNLDQLYQYHAPNWSYYMNLLTPYDNRWKARMIPGLANSPPSYTEHLAEAEGTFARRNPELAANLRWAWFANGASDRGDPIWGMAGILDKPWVQPKEPALTSQIYPGVGVIFRAHQGPDETYMFLRSGYNWSHWYIDQGHFVLFSRGANLVPFQPYQYWWSPNKAFDMYNTIRFGHPENEFPHGWPDSNILDHAFGPTVDYAWSSSGYPAWFINPGSTPGFGAPRKLQGDGQTEGAFTWNRQVLFLKGETAKSPNYFVFRDTMPGEGKLTSYLNLNLLGTKENVKIDGTHIGVKTEWPTGLDLYFAQRQPLQPDFYGENQYVSLGGWSGPSWWNAQKEQPGLSPNWLLKDGKPAPLPTRMYDNPGYHERHVFTRIPGAPGQGYFWVLYPRGENEPQPVITAPMDGVLKIVTPESTDYVFLSPTPISFDADGVIFSGCAGSVRVKKETVTLALTGGPGKIGYKGFVLKPPETLEVTLKLAELKNQYVVSRVPTDQLLNSLPPDGTPVFSVNEPAPVVRTQGNMRIEGRRASIYPGNGSVRFYAPERSYVNMSVGSLGVRGMGPFDLTITDTAITGKVDGDTRTLVVTYPPKLVRPMFLLDGQRWYAGFADDHAFRTGLPTPQFGLAFGVTGGRHTVEIREWTYPALPPAPARARLE